MDAFSNMAWEHLLPFLITCIVIEITPGPNMAFLTIVSATKGRRFGFATVLGVALGLLLIGLAAAAGLASTISNSPILYQGLRVSGVLYLAWLALEEWRDADLTLDAEKDDKRGAFSYLRHGLVVNVLNPKAGVFFINDTAQFH